MAILVFGARRSVRVFALAGSALGALSMPASTSAQNITYNGPGPYSLTRTDPISGGPRAIDVAVNSGDITIDTSATSVTTDNQGPNPRPAQNPPPVGVGIGANNGGPGNVAVRAGTVTATGPGVTNAIDARTTTGAISVTSGTVRSTTAGSVGIIAQSTGGGAVTVNADSTTGGLRGIFTAFGGGLTTINSNFATASGLNTPNAIIGQGATVVVNSTTATLTGNGNQGTAIFVQSGAGGATIISGTASTQGTGQVGVFLGYSAGAGSIASGTVTTTGDFARGIYSSTVGDEIVRSTTVNTSGASATGIYVSPTSSTDANAPALGNVTVASGTITTRGNDAVGILLSRVTAQGDLNASVLQGTNDITSGVIATTGTNAHGIQTASTSGATTIRSTTITTSGANANGIYAAPTTGATTINSGTISATGAGATAILVTGASGAVGVTSSQITTGTGRGIDVLTSSGAVNVASIGTITTSGAAGTGILVNSTTGAQTIAAGSIATSGAGARAISAQSTNGNIGITVTRATTTAAFDENTGETSDAVAAFTSGTGAITIDADVTSATGRYASAVFASGGGAVRITSGTASTTGADNVAVGGSSRTGDLMVAAATTIATGARAQAISATATQGNATVNAGSATATGSTGIVVTAGRNASVTAVTAMGGGDGAGGLIVTGGTGVTLSVGNAASNGTLTTTTTRNGTRVNRADAIFATATNGAITATVGAATATGQGADAIRLVANGTGGAVTASITGAISSTSGTGLFIDPPGAVNIDIAAGASIAGAANGINTTGATNTITNRGTIASTSGAGILAAGTTSLTNSGAISGANNLAVQFGATDDSVTLLTGSVVAGRIVGGGGSDAAILSGSGTASLATQQIAGFDGFSTLAVRNGYWTAASTSGSSFANTVTIQAGATLETANGPAGIAVSAPSIVNNGALVLRSSATSGGSTFGTSVVSGSGTTLFTGAGTAILGGTNSIQSTGAVTVDGGSTVIVTGTQGGSFVTGTSGTLQIGDGGTTGSFTGSLVDNGTLVINRSDAYTFGGALTGAGNIVKQGAGQLVFGSGYAFTGVTTIQGGSIRLTTPVAANTELDLRGSGQFDLSGTTQRIAELGGTSAAASLNIAGGSITNVQATDTTFAGSIVGAGGAFTKSGAGRLNLTGNSSYTGTTTVNGGTLAVNGSIVSPVTVTSGGTLGGTGTVGTTVIGSGGIYAPGNSIGTQAVNGNVTFAAGSIFAVEANALGQSDRVAATGTATLQGGAVAVTPAAGTYGNLTNYTILTAAGGVTGNFASVTSSDSTLTPFLAYGANAVMLALVRNNVVFTGASANQTAVGAAITTLGVNSPLYRGLLPTSVAVLPSVLNQLSGEIFASLPTALADSSKQVREAVLARATQPGEGVRLWGTGGRTLAQTRNENGLNPVNSDRWSVVGGVDFNLSGLRVGVDGGYIEDKTRLQHLGATSQTDTYLVGGHVGYAIGPISLVAGGDYAWHDIATNRVLSAVGLNTPASGNGKAHTVQGYGEIGYGVTTGALTVLPFARFSYVRLVSDALTETSGPGALAVRRDERNYKFGSFGLRVSGQAPMAVNVVLLPRFSAAYTRGWDVDGSRTMAFAGTTPTFTVAGASLGRNAFDVNAGFDLAFGQRLTLGAGGFGSTSRAWSNYGAKASVGLKF